MFDCLSQRRLPSRGAHVEVEDILENKTRSYYSPVFSFISHKTLNKAGFMRWQLRECFLNK